MFNEYHNSKKVTMENNDFISYQRPIIAPSEMLEKASSFHSFMEERRTLREFSEREISKEIMEEILMAASTAPSGAHKQPWVFCAVSDPKIKTQIREAAEKEEYTNYHGRMSEEWVDDLKPFSTNWNKPFLEKDPWLIIVMKKAYDFEGEEKKNNYYVTESVGLAAGFLLTAIHNAGLVALTHTPSPMNFLTKVLERPANERPFLLIPVGYPTENAEVPNLTRKSAEEVIAYYTGN